MGQYNRPDPDRSAYQQLGAPRRVTAVDAAAPVVDSGWDVQGWAQVLLVVEATAVGRAEVQIWRQFRLQATVGGDEVDNFIPGEYISDVGLLDHTGLYKGQATFLVNVPVADRVTALVTELAGGTAVTLHCFGVTRTGEAPLPGALGYQVPQDFMVSAGMNAFHTAGAAKALTTSLVAGSWLDVEGATEGVLGLVVSGTAATSVNVQLAWSPDGGTTIYPLPAVNFIDGGQIDTDDNEYVTPGAAGKHTIVVSFPPRGSVCAYAKRSGGDATTSLLAILYPYKVQ
jgi:hypothetical protein